MRGRDRRRQQPDGGASAIEYGLIIAGTIVGLLAVVVGLRATIASSYASAECKIGSASGCTSPSPTASGSPTSPTSSPSGPAASVTTVATSNPAPAFGQAVTLTAELQPGTANGTVYFVDGATAIGTAQLVNGRAEFTTSVLAIGDHAITAVYVGSLAVQGSTSSAITVAVQKRVSTTTVSVTPGSGAIGTSFSMVATVSPSDATGSITFRDGATTLGTGTISGGQATFDTSTLTAGTHSITAVYGGDSQTQGSTSDAVNLPVAKRTVTLVVSATPTTVAAGSAVTLTATVSPGAATGTVTFLRNGTSVGTAVLSGGVATRSVTLPTGGWFITATYGGDATFEAQPLSNSVAVTVVQPPGAVRSLAAAPSRTSVALTWLPPSGQPGATSYVVSWTPSAGSTRVTATNSTVNGLSRRTSYTFTVVACVTVNFVDVCGPAAVVSARTT